MIRRPEYPEYARTSGFLLVSDVGHTLFERARVIADELSPLTEADLPDELSPSGGGLAGVTRYVSSRMEEFVARERLRSNEQYGVSGEDVSPEGNEFRVDNGLGDLNFTWHFAPGVAHAVMEAFERQGYLSSEQREHLTLTDWVHVLRRRWFSGLVHDLAFTANGIYRSFGENRHDYSDGALVSCLKERGVQVQDDELFDTTLEYDAEGDAIAVAATATEALRAQLRTKMHEQRSQGCPAARRAGSLSLELLDNPHAVRLMRTGRLVVSAIDHTKGLARFTQMDTAIDTGLQSLAYVLEVYGERFGTPFFDASQGRFTHQPLSGESILVRPARIDPAP